ncbi:MAG: diaminopimelate decarboxylase [Candidatus Sericytochromatia bacterium]|nr:diaminopimelate decarboxylase [Candidatus Sericytochromatia bacterium]
MLLPRSALPPFIRPLTAERNAAGELVLGGCKALDLAGQFGTPLLVLDEHTLREACREYVQTLARCYPPGGRILYASKALTLCAIHALVFQEGLGLDVVSSGEFHTALAAGVPAEACVLQGNNKTEDELRHALQNRIGRINVDNLDELRLLLRLARQENFAPRILLRVAPGIEAHTHDFIRTGQEDSKFGLDLKSGQLDEALQWLKASPEVECLGLQAHIGSQIFDAHAFEETAKTMVGLLQEIRERHGFEAKELDLGGGLGIPYVASDDPPCISETVERLCLAVLKSCELYHVPPPRLILEPGRSIVGSAGVTLYATGSRKDVPGIRTYVSLDGGMGDNPRPITYGAQYVAEVAGQAAETTELVTLAGRYCESGDVLISDIELPRLQAGDILAVYATGAYTYAMASHYNRCGRPAVVLVSDGRADIIARRETLDDLIRLDALPPHLRREA